MSNVAEKFVTLADYRDQVIRQDRITTNAEFLDLYINGKKYSVLNYSKFGFAVSAPKNERFPQDGDLLLSVGETKIINTKFKVAHVAEVENDLSVFGLQITGFIDLNRLDAAVKAVECFRSVHSTVVVRDSLDQSFVHHVDKLYFYLKNLKDNVSKHEKEMENLLFDEREKFFDAFIEEAVIRLNNDFVQFHDVLNSLQKITGDKPDEKYLRYAQEMLTPFFLESEFGKRAVEKPLGYAGDYEMMNQIYRKKNEGRNLFGAIVHKHMIETRTCQSVRYRIDLLCKAYKTSVSDLVGNENMYSLSVASGPARELQAFIKESSQETLSKCNFGLLDLDKDSLKYAQSNIFEILSMENKKINISYINDNVIHIALGKTKPLPDNTYHLIYSAGLYDYLDLKLSRVLTKKLYDSLKPGGQLIIGNFAKTNPEKVFIDLILDWYLIHKSDEEMLSMAPAGANAEVMHDPHKIISYLILKK